MLPIGANPLKTAKNEMETIFTRKHFAKQFNSIKHGVFFNCVLMIPLVAHLIALDSITQRIGRVIFDTRFIFHFSSLLFLLECYYGAFFVFYTVHRFVE